mgnify:CR=1 FL=1
MDKDKVKGILSKINYPGFSRDIVSFGMVSGVEINLDEIVINLSITSQNSEKKTILVGDIEKKLGEYFSSVIVNVEEKVPNVPSPGAQQASPEPVLPNVKHVIAVASGKGGVGKSTVAPNVACGLCEKGFKVGLLDLDIYGPSLPITLGINKQPEMTDRKTLVPIEKYGMKVMRSLSASLSPSFSLSLAPTRTWTFAPSAPWARRKRRRTRSRRGFQRRLRGKDRVV